MVISQIVAIAKNHVIGKENDIPWRIPGEQKRFRNLTMNKTVIMGRKTYESLGGDLKGREIIVISKSIPKTSEKFTVCETVEEALKHCEGQEEVFIAGGGQLYHNTIDRCERLYVTELDHEVEGDIYYPNFNRQAYEVTYRKRVDDANIPYTYYTYEKST